MSNSHGSMPEVFSSVYYRELSQITRLLHTHSVAPFLSDPVPLAASAHFQHERQVQAHKEASLTHQRLRTRSGAQMPPGLGDPVAGDALELTPPSARRRGSAHVGRVGAAFLCPAGSSERVHTVLHSDSPGLRPVSTRESF